MHRANWRGVPWRAGIVALWTLTAACAAGDQPTSPPPEQPPVLQLRFALETGALLAGDIVRLTTTAVDEHGTPYPIGPVALTTDDAAVAFVDASARLRAVGPGRTTLRGVAGGTTGSLEIEVLEGPALFALASFDGAALPVLVAADSVDWGSEREYHEVFVTAGALALRGGAQPGYELLTRYQEFDVRYVGGQRTETLRYQWNDYDRGIIAFDPVGNLAMTSEIVAPLHHRAVPVAGGFLVDFRIPGSDDRLDLVYRR